jgi:hypothetical protein
MPGSPTRRFTKGSSAGAARVCHARTTSPPRRRRSISSRRAACRSASTATPTCVLSASVAAVGPHRYCPEARAKAWCLLIHAEVSPSSELLPGTMSKLTRTSTISIPRFFSNNMASYDVARMRRAVCFRPEAAARNHFWRISTVGPGNSFPFQLNPCDCVFS